MLKLKKNVVDFMMINIKSDSVGKYVKATLDQKKDGATSIIWNVPAFTSLCGKGFSFIVDDKDFDEIEDLKPYVWHEAEKWDENPNKYWLLERSELDDVYGGNSDVLCTTYEHEGLCSDTTHFMYIEPLEVEDEDL